VGEAVVGVVGVEDADVFGKDLVAAGFGDLTLERVHAAGLFFEDVGDAEEVGLGVFEFTEGFFFVLFEFGDAGGFLEDHAAVFRFDAVFGFAITEDAAGEGDFVVVGFEGFSTAREGHGDFGQVGGGAFFMALGAFSSVEDDVGHFTATEGFSGGFSENPADGVDNVGFSAAVGADDAGDPFMKVKDGFVCEGFEAVEVEGFEIHG